MGYNNYGQLGNGTVAHSNVPTDVLGLNNVKEISISGYSSLTTVCAILEDGRMKCWGYNGYGQIGNGSTTHAYIPTVVKDLDE